MRHRRHFDLNDRKAAACWGFRPQGSRHGTKPAGGGFTQGLVAIRAKGESTPGTYFSANKAWTIIFIGFGFPGPAGGQASAS